MTYNETCEKFSGDVCWLTSRWLPIRHAFACEATCTLGGDVDLESAYRRVCDLKDKIEEIRTARASTIAKDTTWKAA